MADGLVQSTFPCNQGKSESKCKAQFLEENPQFQFIDVIGDGNCMFRAIAEFYRLSGKPLPPIAYPENYAEPYEVLRAYVVEQFSDYVLDDEDTQGTLVILDYDHRLQQQEEYKKQLQDNMMYYKNKKNIETIQQQIDSLPPILERDIPTILTELAKTCEWNNAAFDMMGQRVATILHINTSIYIVNPPNKQHANYVVDNYVQTPNNGPEADTTVHLILADGHYGLLYPTGNAHGMSAVAAHKKSPSKAKTQKKKPSSLNSQNSSAFGVFNNEEVNNSIVAKQLQMEYNAELAQELQQLSIGNSPSPKKKNPLSAKKKPSVGKFPSPQASFNKATAQNRIPYESITVDAMKILLGNYSLLPKIPENTTEKKRLYRTFIQAIVDNTLSIEEAEIAKSAKSKKHGGTLKKKKYARSASRKNKQR